MNNKKFKLNPYWVTDFIDAEGCFFIRLTKNKQYKVGWRVQRCFQIKLHSRDMDLLLQVKSFYNDIGYIHKINNNIITYQVCTVNELISIIVPHFDKYPLITQKQSDFILWSNIVKLMNKSEHLNKDDLMKIINLRASLNKKLSDKLKIYFPKVIKINRPKINLSININCNWIVGFFTGDGCFYIAIYKSKSNKIDYYVKLQVLVSQHFRDKLLMNSLVSTLECGKVFKRSNENMVDLVVTKFEDINKKIIPLFNKYKIEGIKYLDFQDFCKAIELVKNKAHLTKEDLKKICRIK